MWRFRDRKLCQVAKNPFRTFHTAVMHYGVCDIWCSWHNQKPMMLTDKFIADYIEKSQTIEKQGLSSFLLLLRFLRIYDT